MHEDDYMCPNCGLEIVSYPNYCNSCEPDMNKEYMQELSYNFIMKELSRLDKNGCSFYDLIAFYEREWWQKYPTEKPEEGMRVLVVCTGRHEIARFENGSFGHMDNIVTHWMPLPNLSYQR